MIDTYKRYVDLKPAGRGEWKGKCPFHGEKTASFWVNEKSGYFYCFGCGKGGGVTSFLEMLGKGEEKAKLVATVMKREERQIEIRDEEISPVLVEQLHRNLLNDQKRLYYLLTERRLSYAVVKKYTLGLDTSTMRYAIPVRGRSGRVLNIKLHHSQMKPKCFWWTAGSTRKLFPISSLMKSTVVITEGELDALALLSLGINSITGTGGSSGWDKSWNQFFANKGVKILYDNDKAGLEGGYKVAKQLEGIAAQVEIVELPDDLTVKKGGKDVTDFIRNGGDVFKLLKIPRR